MTTPRPKPTTIIWDLGNVFVRWNPRKLYQTLFPDTDRGRAEMDHFLSNVVNMHTFNEQLDLGVPIQELFAKTIAANPTADTALIYAYDRWRDMLDGEIAETVAMFRATKQRGVRGYALSNWGRHFVDVLDEYPVFHEFDGRVVSYELGIVKPNPEIFTALLTKFDLRAEECLFVDDNRANIDAAKQLGFHVHHFGEPLRLRAALHEHELLPIAVSTDWTVEETALKRRFAFLNFKGAWAFMTHVAVLAEQLDHHPDWSNSWNTVDVSITSHDKGRLTGRDYALAEAIDAIVGIYGPSPA
jgi:2-haloacid dehalogenase